MPDDPKPTTAGSVPADDLLVAILHVRDTMLQARRGKDSKTRPGGQRWDWTNDIETVLGAELFMLGHEMGPVLQALRQPAVHSPEQTNEMCKRLGLPEKFPQPEGTWRDLLADMHQRRARWHAWSDIELAAMIDLFNGASARVGMSTRLVAIRDSLTAERTARSNRERQASVSRWKGCGKHPGKDAPGCHGCWMANHHVHDARYSNCSGCVALAGDAGPRRLCGVVYEHAGGFVEYCWRESSTCAIIGHGDWREYPPTHTHDEKPESRCGACAALGLYGR